MVATFEQVIAEVEIAESELTAWIEQRWILPLEEEGRYFFDEADVARVRLVAELHRDLGVNEEAMPVVLGLLDQVYGLRRTLNALHEAIAQLPAGLRARVAEELARRGHDIDTPGN